MEVELLVDENEVELVLALVEEVEAEVELIELEVELCEVLEVEVVVPLIVAGSIAKVLAVQFNKAPMLSQPIACAPAAKFVLSD